MLGSADGGTHTALGHFLQVASVGPSRDVWMGTAGWQRELLGNLATLLP